MQAELISISNTLTTAAAAQLGCGAGNTVFPLLEANPQAYVYACDFAPRAVRLVQAHPSYKEGRVHAFVADITRPGALAGPVPAGMVDTCMLVFVLSAVTPEKMPQVLFTLACALRKVGCLHCMHAA